MKKYFFSSLSWNTLRLHHSHEGNEKESGSSFLTLAFCTFLPDDLDETSSMNKNMLEFSFLLLRLQTDEQKAL